MNKTALYSKYDSVYSMIFYMTYCPKSFKPLFHCDAKPFALGTFASPNAKDSTFALPNTKNTNMLVSLALGDANFVRHLTQIPNASQWNIGCVGCQMQNLHVGHVHFMLFVSISFVLGSQRKPSIQWNMGFRVSFFN